MWRYDGNERRLYTKTADAAAQTTVVAAAAAAVLTTKSRSHRTD